MKKTIIALLAVSGVTLGDTLTLDGAAYKGTNSTSITLNEALNSITVVATLDINKLQPAMQTGAELSKLTLIDLIDSDANDIGIQTNYGSENNAIKTSGIYGTWNQGNAYDVGMATGTGFERTDFWTNAASASITLTYSYNTGTTAIFTLLDASGSTLKQVGGTWNTSLRGSTANFNSVDFHDSIVESTYVFSQVVTVDEAKALSIAAAKAVLVPEPSTATLSLLVLCGLAARRRRK